VLPLRLAWRQHFGNSGLWPGRLQPADEGLDLVLEHRRPAHRLDAERAAELVQRVAERKPDVIFTPDARIAMFLKMVAAAIPAVAITVLRRDSRATTRG
jgi:hypothetical protein